MSLVSPVQIANMALNHVGAKDTIESFTEASVEARTVGIWYDHARLTSLESHDWTFARKRSELALDEEDPPSDWDYRYQYPSDCIKARRIVNPYYYNPSVHEYLFTSQGDAVPFEIELAGDRQTILCDLPEASLVYTGNVTNTNSFTNHFVNAMSYCLAGFIAYKLTGKIQTKKMMEDNFSISINKAAQIDANEGVDKPPRDAEWIRGR